MPKPSRWQRLKTWLFADQAALDGGFRAWLDGQLFTDDPSLDGPSRLDCLDWGMDPDNDRAISWLELLRAQDFEASATPTKQIGREELSS